MNCQGLTIFSGKIQLPSVPSAVQGVPFTRIKVKQSFPVLLLGALTYSDLWIMQLSRFFTSHRVMRILSFPLHWVDPKCFFQGRRKENKAERIFSSCLRRQLWKFNLQVRACLPREEEKNRLGKIAKSCQNPEFFQSVFSYYCNKLCGLCQRFLVFLNILYAVFKQFSLGDSSVF